ncbi:MAG: metallophosphoesterase family protein [Deltaproteobacteria bacterium]|nr:metallophosphoesterase family protein [Deltaproteobacteria bacterium]
MKTAIISDLHGNAVAVREVLASIEKAGIDRIICLGDIIGYGPEPEAVMATIIKLNIPTIIGNHELAIKQPAFLEWFNPNARISLEKTREMLSEESLAFIDNMPNAITENGCRFVHGYPPDSPTIYLFEVPDERLEETLEEMEEHVCFVGHTHELILVSVQGDEIERRILQREVINLAPDKKYIINSGSVGQPRDGNNYAKYLIYDHGKDQVAIKYVPYNINETIGKIYQAGLPEQHAWRLL